MLKAGPEFSRPTSHPGGAGRDQSSLDGYRSQAKIVNVDEELIKPENISYMLIRGRLTVYKRSLSNSRVVMCQISSLSKETSDLADLEPAFGHISL